MFGIIGIIAVFAAIGIGYWMEDGNFAVLYQPAEYVIILGAVLGSILLGNSKDNVVNIFKHVFDIFKSPKSSKAFYMDMLVTLSGLFMKIRREGLVAIENDIENPGNSPIFSNFVKDKTNGFIVAFVCDTMRIFSTVNIERHEFDNIMDADIEVYIHERMIPSHSIQVAADALPGMGIVAAVLGVVLTMGKITEPPEVLGHHIGAALVGTFLGVLCAYGFVGPIAQNLGQKAKEEEEILTVVKSSLGAFVGGNPPPVALEAGRRAIPNHYRPSFQEFEDALKAARK